MSTMVDGYPFCEHRDCLGRAPDALARLCPECAEHDAGGDGCNGCDTAARFAVDAEAESAREHTERLLRALIALALDEVAAECSGVTQPRLLPRGGQRLPPSN